MDSFPNILEDILVPSDSDDDFEMLAKVVIDEEKMRRRRRAKLRRGSVTGHKMINRFRRDGHERLFLDYFSETPVYPDHLFRRRFRMRRSLFCRIVNEVEQNDPYFIQKSDVVGVQGLYSLQKVTTAFRMLAYGNAADSADEYVRIGESTAIESLRRFVKSIVEVFGDEYLREPNTDDIAKLLALGEQRGFPGMLGSIDCMHWKWKNCPSALKGMYSGHCHESTIILEVVASQNLWIWHAYFGLPGSLNDINVLERSSVFSAVSEGRAPLVNYMINGNAYKMGYYLADGIYPTRSTFVKTISCPQGRKAQYFVAAQESARKDVERAFGVLQARFAIVRQPARLWDIETLAYIMKACIIMHNMIIEDEGTDGDYNFEENSASVSEPLSNEARKDVKQFIEKRKKIKDSSTHARLQADLVEHLWQRHGEE